ncbi:pilus assembly protein PilO [Neobacillus sp. OS1-32]|uniref:Pilus assembly protein PilO n=1 Tax=Neobacillus paridis TaxID=2803862 RepID=A0ABS1TIZ9_9BACI|nr:MULTISPECIES: pilus assembly protein PilO [Neobacillus]MBL4951237.1 pilus assembly protein PilO [Neobacillus paridis]WML30555.1 pilus assembly protein PilO [Neobacillus sp. OS1-32]
MTLEFSKKHTLGFILGLIVIGLLAVLAYYVYIIPINTNLDQKKSELKMTNQELTIYQNKLKQTSNQTIVSSMELQQQVPVKRMLDQLLLDIEKAEIISGANIIETKLNSSGQDAIQAATNDTAQKTQSNSSSASTSKATATDKTLPNGMKQTSILLSGEANSYFEMEKFLEEIKSLKRIIKIDQLKFTGQEEMVSVEQASSPLKFEAVLTAYYDPELVDLQKDLPPIDVPKVSNKKNPLSDFLAEEDDQEP